MKIENTYGNNTSNLRSHFNQLDPVHNLGQRRFELLRYALNPTIEELDQIVDILATNSKK